MWWRVSQFSFLAGFMAWNSALAVQSIQDRGPAPAAVYARIPPTCIFLTPDQFSQIIVFLTCSVLLSGIVFFPAFFFALRELLHRHFPDRADDRDILSKLLQQKGVLTMIPRDAGDPDWKINWRKAERDAARASYAGSGA